MDLESSLSPLILIWILGIYAEVVKELIKQQEIEHSM